MLLYELDAASAFGFMDMCLYYANKTMSPTFFGAILEMHDLKFVKYFINFFFAHLYRDWERKAKICILFCFQLFS